MLVRIVNTLFCNVRNKLLIKSFLTRSNHLLLCSVCDSAKGTDAKGTDAVLAYVNRNPDGTKGGMRFPKTNEHIANTQTILMCLPLKRCWKNGMDKKMLKNRCPYCWVRMTTTTMICGPESTPCNKRLKSLTDQREVLDCLRSTDTYKGKRYLRPLNLASKVIRTSFHWFCLQHFPVLW